MKKWIFCVATVLVLCSGVANADALDDAEAFFLSAGAFQSAPDAEILKARFALLGIEAKIQTIPSPDKGVWHRVLIGPYTSVEELNRTRDTLKQNGIETSLIRVRAASSAPSPHNKQSPNAEHLISSPPVFPSPGAPLTYTPVGEILIDPQAADVNTAQLRTASQRDSYLNRAAMGAVAGLVLGAIAGLFILLRAFIRKVKAPAKSASALTAAVGATAMQRLRQGIADYVGGTKECPFCKETVKTRAVVCKHCHRDI